MKIRASLGHAPPLPTIYLTDLTPRRVTVGWGRLGHNRAVSGTPLRIKGVTYTNGLGVHARSVLIYAIPPGVRRFVATAGLDDAKADDERSSVQFRILGDVRARGEPPVEIAVSPEFRDQDRIWQVDLTLDPRFRDIQLIVEDAGDGIAADHADWVNAGFIK